MFEAFYGLREDPFRLSADHRFCFAHRNYARARAYVDYALHRAEGFVMVTGSPGTGKTTLINELLNSLPKDTTRAATLLSTRLEAEDLLRMTAYALGLESRMQPKAMLLQQLMESMHEYHRRGVRTLLIIDEAQDLGASALEELRLLTNLHQAGHPLLQIVLVGQEPLRELVRQPEMEQLHQRLIAAWHLQPLDPEETIGYVRHRLETAGWQGDPVFEPGVMEAVYAFSQGVPRRINLVCSRLLLHGCISELHRLTEADALDLVHELGEEELAPSAERASASEQSKVDWAAIDQGLDWTPREALVLTEEPEPELEPEPEPEPAVRASRDAIEIPEAAEMPQSAETASAGAEQANSSTLGQRQEQEQAEEQPLPAPSAEQVRIGSRLEPTLNPLPGLAVEDAGGGNGARVERAASRLAQAQAAELPRARSSPRIIRRRSAGILGFILFVLLSLVPAGILLLPMVAGLSASMPAAVPWSPPLPLS
ncbi:ExeA family protein [Halochromatium salexigens]|uniref:AAA+ ATPase domain-containing protein n=1 Tax=Halochromatium salexigens TaxID=49447 RepID=A0AAJ0UFU7_HALSE|nr:AAA family ATPase [Halochromatium salexigens]MBK5930546.1 hypothetical protein [Halochromatium salexigens]